MELEAQNNEELLMDGSNVVMPPSAISLADDGLLFKVITKEGLPGPSPTTGNKVTVHYTGRLLDGTVFDSSVRRGDKFSFNLGKGEVIRGWDVGVASMRRDETCEIFCSPSFAYGEQGSPPTIPANTALVFEIELFEWEGEDLSENKDKSIVKEVLKDGLDYSTANEGALVEIDLIGEYNDVKFDERAVKYNVGEADDELDIVPAIDVCLKSMRRQEKCRLLVNSRHAYGEEGCKKHNIPPNADLVYEITLKKFEKAKEAWELTDEEKMEESRIVKEKGTAMLKKGKLDKAIVQYKKISDFLEYHDFKDTEINAEEKLKMWNDLKLAGCLNLALCYNKLKDHAEAVLQCESALEIDADCEKALYRMGEAHFAQKDYNSAKISFSKAVKVNPNNKSARSMYTKCVDHIKKMKDQERSMFKGMFDKFSKEDKEAEIKKKVEQQKERAKAKAAKKVKTQEEGEVQNGVTQPEAETQANVES